MSEPDSAHAADYLKTIAQAVHYFFSLFSRLHLQPFRLSQLALPLVERQQFLRV